MIDTAQNLLDKDKEMIWHPFTPLEGAGEPILIESAKGVYLHTEDGRSILDAVSSWWVNNHGHSNEHIAKAVAKQALEMEHVIFAGFTHKPAIQLAENVLSILPDNQKKAFYSDNGSTAVEVGMKMAFQYWYNRGIENKKKIIAFEEAYHGDTFGAMSVGGRSAFTAPFAPYLFDVEYVGLPVKGKESDVLADFEAMLDKGDVGAFIFEPLIQGAGGMRMYSPEVLDKMIRMAQEKEVICIADEVMTGFGRTGKYFASNHLTEKPDIFCLSKGLTGGTMALGMTTCSEEIVSAYRSSEWMKTFFHGHSYTGNPLACAVGNASFELLTDKTCRENLLRIEKNHRRFKAKIESHERLREVRIQGTVIAMEIETEGATSYFNNSREAIYQFFLERDILLRPLGNVLYILPPYIITDEELQRIYSAIEEFLNS